MIVRNAIAEDEDQFIELCRAHVREHADFMPFDEYVTRKSFRKHVNGDIYETVFVVEERGKLIGYLVAVVRKYLYCNEVMVCQELVYIHPDYRNGSIKAFLLLMDEFVKFGKRMRAKEIFTGVITGGRKAEQTAKLFERLGFDHVGFYERMIPDEFPDAVG